MRSIYIAFTFGLLAVAGCNNSPATTNTGTADAVNKQAKAPAAVVQSQLSAAGTQLLMSVVTGYYGLKNALVATKAARTDSAAGQLTAMADSLQSFLQKDGANAATLKPYIDTIVNQSRQVAAIKDETCEKQRLAFGPLSSAMFGLLKAANIKHAGIYREYCPMAFNEKGGYWLSDEAEIKNPYFGKKMMECGEVVDSL